MGLNTVITIYMSGKRKSENTLHLSSYIKRFEIRGGAISE
jgi:hypothetical protein